MGVFTYICDETVSQVREVSVERALNLELNAKMDLTTKMCFFFLKTLVWVSCFRLENNGSGSSAQSRNWIIMRKIPEATLA